MRRNWEGVSSAPRHPPAGQTEAAHAAPVLSALPGDPAGSLRAGQTRPEGHPVPAHGQPRAHAPADPSADSGDARRAREGPEAEAPQPLPGRPPGQRPCQRNCREQTLNSASGTKHGRQAEEGGESSGHGLLSEVREDPPHLPGGCQPHPARSSRPSQGSQPPEEHGSGETLGALPCTSPPACLPRGTARPRPL